MSERRGHGRESRPPSVATSSATSRRPISRSTKNDALNTPRSGSVASRSSRLTSYGQSESRSSRSRGKLPETEADKAAGELVAQLLDRMQAWVEPPKIRSRTESSLFQYITSRGTPDAAYQQIDWLLRRIDSEGDRARRFGDSLETLLEAARSTYQEGTLIMTARGPSCAAEAPPNHAQRYVQGEATVSPAGSSGSRVGKRSDRNGSSSTRPPSLAGSRPFRPCEVRFTPSGPSCQDVDVHPSGLLPLGPCQEEDEQLSTSSYEEGPEDRLEEEESDGAYADELSVEEYVEDGASSEGTGRRYLGGNEPDQDRQHITDLEAEPSSDPIPVSEPEPEPVPKPVPGPESMPALLPALLPEVLPELSPESARNLESEPEHEPQHDSEHKFEYESEHNSEQELEYGSDHGNEHGSPPEALRGRPDQVYEIEETAEDGAALQGDEKAERERSEALLRSGHASPASGSASGDGDLATEESQEDPESPGPIPPTMYMGNLSASPAPTIRIVSPVRPSTPKSDVSRHDSGISLPAQDFDRGPALIPDNTSEVHSVASRRSARPSFSSSSSVRGVPSPASHVSPRRFQAETQGNPTDWQASNPHILPDNLSERSVGGSIRSKKSFGSSVSIGSSASVGSQSPIDLPSGPVGGHNPNDPSPSRSHSRTPIASPARMLTPPLARHPTMPASPSARSGANSVLRPARPTDSQDKTSRTPSRAFRSPTVESFDSSRETVEAAERGPSASHDSGLLTDAHSSTFSELSTHGTQTDPLQRPQYEQRGTSIPRTLLHAEGTISDDRPPERRRQRPRNLDRQPQESRQRRRPARTDQRRESTSSAQTASTQRVGPPPLTLGAIFGGRRTSRQATRHREPPSGPQRSATMETMDARVVQPRPIDTQTHRQNWPQSHRGSADLQRPPVDTVTSHRRHQRHHSDVEPSESARRRSNETRSRHTGSSRDTGTSRSTGTSHGTRTSGSSARHREETDAGTHARQTTHRRNRRNVHNDAEVGEMYRRGREAVRRHRASRREGEATFGETVLVEMMAYTMT